MASPELQNCKTHLLRCVFSRSSPYSRILAGSLSKASPGVIVGGESGPGARPMEEKWVISVQEQCEAAGVPFFFKQWGGVRKKITGRTLRGKTHDGIPGRVQHPVLPAAERQYHVAEINNGPLVQLLPA